jgi:CheY-like chemotaxis protein
MLHHQEGFDGRVMVSPMGRDWVPVAGGPRRVLIIDDNVDLAENIAEILQMDGHRTEIAASAELALPMALANTPDVSGDGLSHLVYLAAYIIPTVIPFFVSTANLARTIGVTLVMSLAATVVVQRDALTSVWCFFAAILSALVLVSVAREQRALPAPALKPLTM